MIPTVTTPTAVQVSGASNRQLTYWRMNGHIAPAIAAEGSGSRVGWSLANCIQAAKFAVLSKMLSDAKTVDIGIMNRMIARNQIEYCWFGVWVTLKVDFDCLEAQVAERFDTATGRAPIGVAQ